MLRRVLISYDVLLEMLFGVILSWKKEEAKKRATARA
jgi:hypothetical protein